MSGRGAATRAETTDCAYVGDRADGEFAGAVRAGMAVWRTVDHNDTGPGWVGRWYPAWPGRNQRLRLQTAMFSAVAKVTHAQ